METFAAASQLLRLLPAELFPRVHRSRGGVVGKLSAVGKKLSGTGTVDAGETMGIS